MSKSTPSGTLQEVPLMLCEPFPNAENRNDRREFAADALQELADSINTTGLIHQPHVERKADGTGFNIVCGERRIRAMRDVLGWEFAPVFVHDTLTPAQRRAIMGAENTGRVNLNAIEEAGQFVRMIEQDGLSAADVGRKVGKSAEYVREAVKLLALRPDIQELIAGDHFPKSYALVMARAGLDANRQGLAFADYRKAKETGVTLDWFKMRCSELAEQQASDSLFNLDGFTLTLAEYTPSVKSEDLDTSSLPLPGVTRPPARGLTVRAVIEYQVKFWRKAAGDWSARGRKVEADKCQAAADALTMALDVLPDDPPALQVGAVEVKTTKRRAKTNALPMAFTMRLDSVQPMTTGD